MCHSKWCDKKFAIKHSYRLIEAVRSYWTKLRTFFLVLIYCIYLFINATENGRRFNLKSCMQNLKIDVRQETGYSPLNGRNFMFACAYEKINILLSILNILFFLFYDFNLNTQFFVYLEFVKYQLASIETSKFSRNAM